MDTSRLPASHNHNTPTAGRRGATLSATYLGGHLTFTSITHYNTPTAGRRGATLSATYLGGHLTFTSNHRQADRQTDRQNNNMTWIAIGLGEVRRKDERFTPAVPLWSRQWTSRCRRPRKLFYIDFLLIFSRHDLPSASRRRKMLPCTEEEVEALFYFISNLYLTLYPIRTLSIPFPNFTAVHGVGVAQAKPACKHTIATRKCYQYNTKELEYTHPHRTHIRCSYQ